MPNISRDLSLYLSNVTSLSSNYYRLYKTNLEKEAAISHAFKGLSKTFSGYRCSADIFNLKILILDAILNIVVVDINMYTTLTITFTTKKLNRRFIITIDKYRVSVITAVAKLLKKVVELYSFLCRIRKCYILYLYY